MRNVLMLVLLFVAIIIVSPQTIHAAEGDIWFILDNDNVSTSENFDVEVHVDTGGKDLGAFNLFFDFDPVNITIDTGQSADGFNKGANTSSYIMVANLDDVGNGHYRFSGIDAHASANGNDVHLITIHASTTANFVEGVPRLALRMNELVDKLTHNLEIGTVSDATIMFLQPTCDEYHYNLCTDEALCNNAAGFWCSGICKENVCGESGDEDSILTKISKVIFKQKNNKYELNTKSNNYVKKRKLVFEGEEIKLVEGKVKLYVDGDREDEENIDSNGKWKIKYKAKNGSNKKYKLKFYNKNGDEVDSESYIIRVDTEDPTIDIPDYLNKRRGDILWWNNEDNYKLKKVSIYWDGKKYKFKFKDVQKGEMRRQEFIIPANASKGEHHIKIKTYDKCGNTTNRYITVNVL
ncbi:MAG: hypothetical protein ACKUBY_05695 [Candidatus Moraniibacteriota bacterium]